MSYTKITYSIIGIFIVLYFSYTSYKQEKREQLLFSKGRTIQVKILEIQCGKKAFIKFRVNGKERGQRIYLSINECEELKKKTQIGIKTDSQNNIVFANENYNDWSEAESVSIILLALFFVFCIFYYGIKPEIAKHKKEISQNL